MQSAVCATSRWFPWQAAIRTVTNPLDTFSALAGCPKVGPVYLLHMIISTAAFAFVAPRAVNAVVKQVAMTGEGTQVVVWAGIGGGLLGALATPWLVGLTIALIAMGLGLVLGATVPFRSYMSMVGYAHLPVAIGALLQSAITALASSGAEATRITISFAAFLPADANPYIRAALTTLNPFDLWYLVLLCVGFAAINRVRPTRGAGLGAVVYVLGLLLAMAGPAFSGAAG